MITNFITIAIIHFLGVIAPGQDFIGITRFTLKNGTKNAYKYAIGIAFGQGIYILLSIFGIIEALFMFSFLKKTFFLLSGIYLLYLGYLLIKTKKYEISNTDAVSDVKNPFLSGFYVTISNPKAPIFYVAVLANFMNDLSSKIFMFFISVYMIFSTFVIFLLIAIIFDKFRYKILKYIYYIEKFFALCLFYFAINLFLKIS
jgi:threonine/homoserine/homoserine lactone efflux protein